jgi:BirA family biotin operon repressor/biotin-[acetyl-CoA-carboxylase] ligase
MRFPVRHFTELDSTNSEAARLAQAGEAGPLWIVAERQTAGRGRRGRVWQGASGNLAATLLLTTDQAPAQAAQMAFVTALALADMAAAFVAEDLIRVKWPNDLLVGGAKAGGVLIETGAIAAPPFPLLRGEGSGMGVQPVRSALSRSITPNPDLSPLKGERSLWLAVGVGANLTSAPTDMPYPATSLAAHGPAPSPADALEALDASFARWLDVWETRGFEPIRTAWMGRAHGLGQVCTVSLGDRTVTGVHDGLDADGALLLRVGGALQRITAGDVIFGGV